MNKVFITLVSAKGMTLRSKGDRILCDIGICGWIFVSMGKICKNNNIAIGQLTNSPAPKLMPMVEPLLLCWTGRKLKQSNVFVFFQEIQPFNNGLPIISSY